MLLSRLEQTLSMAGRGPFLSPPGDGDGGGGSSSGDTANSGAKEGSEEGKGGEGGKEGGDAGNAGGESASVETVSIIVDGKTYLLQEHAQRRIGEARAEGRKTGKTEAEQAAALTAAREKGDLEGVITGLEAKVSELEADIASRNRTDLRATVAVGAGLVGDHADLVDLIVGETEEEMKASAKKLADRVLPKRAVDTEAGAGAGKRNGTTTTSKNGSGSGTNGGGESGAKALPSHSWVPAGAVQVPDDV